MKKSGDKYNTQEIVTSDLRSEFASAKPKMPKRSDTQSRAQSTSAQGKPPVRRSRKKLFTGTLALLIVILIIIYMCARAFGGAEAYRVTDNMKGKFLTAFDGSCDINETVEPNSVVSIDTLGKRLIVLSTDSAAVYTASGGKLYSAQHTYTRPVCAVNGDMAAIYDLASGRYFIEDEVSEYISRENKGKLLCVAVGADGSYVVAGDSETAQSELTVYGREHKAKFEWKCSSGYISAAALSSDGKKLAVASIGVGGAELLSRITLFSLDIDKPLATFDYPDEAIFSVKFTEDDTVTAIGTGMRSVIDVDKKEKTDDVFGTTELEDYYADACGRSIAGFSNFGIDTDSVVRAYAPDGSLMFEKKFDDKVKSVSCSGSGFAALVGDTVWCFNKNGDVIGKHVLGTDAEKIAVGGRFVYILSLGSITCRHIYSSSDINSAATNTDTSA